MLSVIGSFLFGFFTSLLANYLSPGFNRLVNRIFWFFSNQINPEKFDLSGVWVQSFKEPSKKNPKRKENEEERIELQHFGNVVTGTGETKKLPRTFYYDCRVSHNMLYGKYKKKGQKGNISGAGMVQLMIEPDRTEMIGQATWFDHDTQKIESSAVNWKRL